MSVELTRLVLVTVVVTGVPLTLLEVTIGVPGAVLTTVGADGVEVFGALEPALGAIGPNGVVKLRVVPTSLVTKRIGLSAVSERLNAPKPNL